MADRSPVPRPDIAPSPRVASPAVVPRSPRTLRRAERRARRRRIIAGLLPAQAVLAAIVVAGMITGVHQGRSGSAPVVTVELAGAVCLALLALGVSGGLALRRGRGRRFPWWALLALPMFVFWAALRVSEYTS
ncbi:MAG TPA: hypothetical protein VFN55_05445 [Solirubrobacteraceae bacterium]|nr:hypothetical protein [Solirubrobacteraceae bacterium]